MKKIVLLLGIILLITVCGCGQNPASPEIYHDPVITSLSISPASANLNDGGGKIVATIAIGFTDADGDIDTIIFKTSAGSKTTAITGLSGNTGGTFYAYVNIITTARGSFNYDVCLTDKSGNTSNHYAGVYSIL